jgi:PAS domain S-box-containing protein
MPLERHEIERQIEKLNRMLAQLRPASRAEARRASLVVTDRIDLWGRYHHIDPQAEDILGYPQSHYRTEVGWVRFNHPEDRWRTAILWEKALAGAPCPLMEYRTHNTEGQWVWLQDSLRPVVFDLRGHALVVEGRWRDITPSKRRQAEFLLRQWEWLLKQDTPVRRPQRCQIVPFPDRPRPGGPGS